VSSEDALRACDVRWGVLCAHKVTLAAVLAMTLASGALPPSTALPSGLTSILLAAPCLMDFDPLRVMLTADGNAI
jgi:hypothetical protein